jgi:hypothetical protein
VRAAAVLLAAFLATGAAAAQGRIVTVGDSEQLRTALLRAKAGDEITLLPGVYRVSRRTPTAAAGTEAEPIVVRAAKLGDALVEANTTEAFVVGHPWWRFENLEIKGACAHEEDCEHAFHIVGQASHTVIRHNRITEFNAMIKGNGLNDKASGTRSYPDDVLIEDNFLFNTTIRNVSLPVTPIDVVGGERWIVRGNFIADFAKSGGDRATYGAFLKGNSRDGVFERNLVICEWRHSGGIRVGLSFGGGGVTSKALCQDGDCTYQHSGGLMRNNIVMDCPNDTGIYVNASRNVKILNNTIYNANGVDVRFPQSSAEIRNNIIAGGIRSRDDGAVTAENNLVTGFGFMNWGPGGARYIKRRLEGQDVKYPNFVSTENVRWAQDLVDSVAEFVGSSWLGRGNRQFDAWFVAPMAGDFRLSDGSEIVDKGEVLKEVRDDFCGRPRRTPPHDLGAIEYGAEICAVRSKLDEAAGLSVRH